MIDTLNKVETRTAIISLRNDNIIHIHFKNDIVILKSDIHANLEVIREIIGSKKHLFLYTADGIISITKDAREASEKQEANTPIIATALIANNLPLKLLTDFYIKFHPPQKPLKVFTNVDKGIEWLKTFEM